MFLLVLMISALTGLGCAFRSGVAVVIIGSLAILIGASATLAGTTDGLGLAVRAIAALATFQAFYFFTAYALALKHPTNEQQSKLKSGEARSRDSARNEDRAA
jgi:hypothetical protein